MKSVLPSPQTEVKAMGKTSRQDYGNSNNNKKGKQDDKEYTVNIQRGESDGQKFERRVKFKREQIDLAIECGFPQEKIQGLKMELYEILSSYNDTNPPSNINYDTPLFSSTSNSSNTTSSGITSRVRRSDDVSIALDSQLV